MVVCIVYNFVLVDHNGIFYKYICFPKKIKFFQKNITYCYSISFCPTIKTWCQKTRGFIQELTFISKETSPFKRNSLILVQNVSAGRVLQQNTGYTFIHGENTSAGDNEIFKEILEKSEGVSFIATYQKYSTGISIKNLHTIMFYEQPAGDIKMIQSIGRGLRRHLSKVTDKPVRIIDLFTDKKYSKRHKSKRINTYEEEGFRIVQTTFDMVNGFVN